MYAMKNKLKTQKIVLVLRLIHASWREFLKGFLDRARNHPNWSIRLMQSPDELTPKLVGEIAKNGTDAMVVCESIPPQSKIRLQALNIPLVIIGTRDRDFENNAEKVVFIRNDDEDIGRFGARYMLSLGNFASWGFVHEKTPIYWSELRCSGFTKELKAAGKKTEVFFPDSPSSSPDSSPSLSDWLAMLPKPAAVMAAYDGIARKILEVCEETHIKVPQQVAILGVDNDPLLCDFSKPSITSIAPDHAKEGRIATDTLAALLRKSRKGFPKTILSNAKSIFERESTAHISPSTTLIKRALAFIDRNCEKPIRVKDVIDYLGVSRSLADLRFRETRGETLSQAITRRRLEEVARKLAKTHLPIHKISTSCGFSNVNHLKNLFRRHYGKSMREWRSGTTRDRTSITAVK